MQSGARFEIRYVDNDARLYVLVTSADLFIVACYARDILRDERGGDWIILDTHTGLCVADTRPHVSGASVHDARVSEESAEVETPSIASGPMALPGPPGDCTRDATAHAQVDASSPTSTRRRNPTTRRAPIEVD